MILGGGRSQFNNSTDSSEVFCKRGDGKNLIEDWKKNKTNAKYVATAQELAAVETAATNYLLGKRTDRKNTNKKKSEQRKLFSTFRSL